MFFSSCLRRRRFNLNRRANPNIQITTLANKSEENLQQWTVVDSDGESDTEYSVNLSTSESSLTNKCNFAKLRLDLREDLVDVESVSSLIDQSDMFGLIDFLFLHCGDIGRQNNHVVLFAFANWLVTTFDRAVNFLHTPNERSAHFQRQIVKQITAILSALLTGLRLRIQYAITDTSQSRLYPSLSKKDPVDLNLILAQYDELCLRVTEFFLSNVPSPTTKLTCWRRFARISPMYLYSSRAKVQFYLHVISSISSEAGNVEEEFWEKQFLLKGDSSFPPNDETVVESMNMGGVEVVSLLQAALTDQGWLADSFITVLGQLASLDCRAAPCFNDQLWQPSDIPTMERLLVERILDILFCVREVFNWLN